MVESATLRPLSLLGLACSSIQAAIACGHLKISDFVASFAAMLNQLFQSFALAIGACSLLLSIFKIVVLASLLWLAAAPLKFETLAW
jgi:hypothetical protein